MSQKISNEQLKHKIVTTIREEGLDGIFDENIINAISEKVKLMYKKSQINSEEIAQDLNETDMRPPVQTGPNHFPYENDFVEAGIAPSQEVAQEEPGLTAGEMPVNVPYEPVRAISAQVPEPLKNQEPGEIIVFDYNDVNSVSGENLANKPFRTKDNPDEMKTIHDFWMKDGKVEVKVYAAKFEEIGTIKFNYQNGTAFFEDKSQAPAPIEQTTYQDNPYATPSSPVIEKPTTETDLRKSIESSVDLQAALMNVMKDILRDGLSSMPRVTEPTDTPAPVPPAQPVYERQKIENIKPTLVPVQVPESIKQRLLGENDGKAEYLSQSNQYATYLYEGKKYIVFNDDESVAYIMA